jgi:hypothetical protein
MTSNPVPSAPVAEIERRLKWRVIGIVGFLALMVMMAAMALGTVLLPVRMRDGLPDDPDLAQARAALRDRVPLYPGTLRFRTALLGEAPAGAAVQAGLDERLEDARALVERARARHRGDPRLEAAIAHLDLALGQLVEAEHRYRAVTDGGADVPEARLGLGLALAREADLEREPARASGLRLEAISQWVAVDPRADAHAAALYDRAVLLAALGRGADAAQAASAYLALDDTSAWAARLRATIGR